jgi:hypothetical protein
MTRTHPVRLEKPAIGHSLAALTQFPQSNGEVLRRTLDRAYRTLRTRHSDHISPGHSPHVPVVHRTMQHQFQNYFHDPRQGLATFHDPGAGRRDPAGCRRVRKFRRVLFDRPSWIGPAVLP